MGKGGGERVKEVQAQVYNELVGPERTVRFFFLVESRDVVVGPEGCVLLLHRRCYGTTNPMSSTY